MAQDEADFYSTMRQTVDDHVRDTAWRWLDSVDDFLQGRGKQYMALVSESERQLQAALTCMCDPKP